MKRIIISTIGLFFVVLLIGQTSSQIPYIDSLIEISKTEKDPYRLVKTYSELCWLQRSRQPDDAIKNGNLALQILNQNPQYDSLRAKVLNYLGVVNRNRGDYSAAMSYYFEALKNAEKNDNMVQIAYSNNNLGGVFTLKGDYENAIEYLEEALHYFTVLQDYRGVSYVSINLGNLYRHNGELDEAIDYFDRALDYKRKVNDTIGEAIVMNLKAITYFEKQDFNRAHLIYKKLQKRYEINQDVKGLSVIKNYLGLLELKNNQYQKAIRFFEEAKKLNIQIEYKSGIAITNLHLGMAYHQLGQNGKAFDFLKKGMDLAKEIGDTESLLKAYEYYSSVYSDLRQYKEAFEYEVKRGQQMQLVFSHEARERLAALKINNEIDKRNSINRDLNQLNEKLIQENKSNQQLNRKYQWFAVFLIFLLLVVFLRLLILYKRNKSKVSHNTELISAVKELQEANHTRDRFLSIIGHDLKNPFNSVLGLTSLLVEEWDTIPNEEKKYILNEVHGTSNTLYELMDNLLLWAKNQSNSIKIYKEEFDVNEHIIDIYELFRNQASFKEIKIILNIGDKNIVYADTNMINTVIRNLISNAIKFTRKGGKVEVDVKLAADELEFNVSDNGKGILPEDLKRILDDKTTHTTRGTSNETGTGLGLLLVKEFIRQNDGVFWVDSKPGIGSRFCFTLPRGNS